MKLRINIIVLLLISLFASKAYSQEYSLISDNLDSLKKEIHLPHTEVEMATLYFMISSTYLHMNSDSSIHYAEKCLALKKNKNTERLRFNATGIIVEGLTYKGNLPKALEIGLAGIDEDTELSLGESNKGRIYNGIGEIYFYLEDYKKARYYFTELTNITGPDKMGIAFGHYQLARIYEAQDKPDSALYHLNKSREVFKLINKSSTPYFYEVYPGWYNTRAKVYLKQNKPESAKADLFKTLEITKNSKEEFHTSNTYYDLALLFQTLNQNDSSVYYAEKALSVAEGINYVRGILNASKILSVLYEKIDSKKALEYYKINAEAKNQLYSSGNIQAMKDIVAQNEKRTAELQNAKEAYQNKLKQYLLFFGLAAMLLVAFILYLNNRRKEKANKILQSQKEEIDYQKQSVEKALQDLKSTQDQLVHAEKMASLGELTAGIAHEIQNPLNFVNNFSEVSEELVGELKEELTKGDVDEAIAISDDVIENLNKINHHGKRASFIVNGMLEHSRTSSGEKTPTDVNILAEEFLKLSYHGLRAKDKNFNAEFKIEFDEQMPLVNLVAQDVGRVILNLINNAFYACAERSRSAVNERNLTGFQNLSGLQQKYKPTVTVTTRNLGDRVEISVKDNGNGIPDSVKAKIFQPFFTTKPAGEGTGLGLSMSYDIITKGHGGEIKVETKAGEGTEFKITLPLEIIQS